MERLGKDCFVLSGSWVGWAHNLSKGPLWPLENSTVGQVFLEPMKKIP